MTPAARIATTITVLEHIRNAKIPMDNVMGDWFRSRRFVGSKDRREIAERLYRIMRHHARYSWWLEQLNVADQPRSRVMLDCIFHDEKPFERYFSGQGGRYAPEAADAHEQQVFEKLSGADLEPQDMPEAVRLEIPEWAYPKLKDRFGDDLKAEAKAMLETACLDVRVNVLKSTVDQALASLKKDGVEAEACPYSAVGLRLKGKTYLAKTKAFREGWIEIQDEGSQLIASLCDVKPGMRVLDYCAGGGGKTLALAAAMENKGSIVAMDNDARRLEKGRKRYRKAGVHNVELRCIEEPQHQKWFKRQKQTMDVVLVDAPCSSSGTWRRNPDLRWRQFGPELEAIKQAQSEILSRVAKCVKPGGRLVYATCSLFREENEDQVEAFLRAHSEFEILPLSKVWPYETSPPCDGPHMSLSPAKHQTDGFFTAIMQKKS